MSARGSLLMAALLAVSCAGATNPPSKSGAGAGADVKAETTAIARAEEFVRINGYVRREDADPARAQFESCCADGPPIERVLDRRAGSLLPSACGVSPERDHWIVAFCFDPRSPELRENPEVLRMIPDRSRAVLVGADGWIRIAHHDFAMRSKGVKPLPGLATFDELLRRYGPGGR